MAMRDRDQPFRRITVLGSSGAGKSTLAVALRADTGLPVVHLDKEYWQPGWTEPDRDAWNARLAGLAAAPEWIIDGQYGSSLHARLTRRSGDLPRPADFGLSVARGTKDRRVLWPRPVRHGCRLPRKGRPRIPPLCRDLSPITAAESRRRAGWIGRTHGMAAIAARAGRVRHDVARIGPGGGSRRRAGLASAERLFQHDHVKRRVDHDWKVARADLRVPAALVEGD